MSMKRSRGVFSFCLGVLMVLSGCLGGTLAAETTYTNPAMLEDVQYRNPVFDENFADPCIIRAEDGTIYAYATQDQWADGQTHLCAILKTTDLVNWTYVGDVFDQIPSWNYGQAIWATDIINIGGTYVFYYTLIDDYESNPAIGAAVADSPEGPFVDKGKILDRYSIGLYAIDPFPVYDEDGKLYLICGNYEQGSYYIELAADGLSTIGNRKQLCPGFEGVYIIRRNGYYYLFGSLGSVWEGENSTYHVCVARSENLLGPYVNKSGEVLTEKNKDIDTLVIAPGSGERFFGGPGNCSILQDDNGVDWMIYHAVDSDHPYIAKDYTRRPMCIDPLVWDEDGWPSILNLQPSLEGYARPVFSAK